MKKQHFLILIIALFGAQFSGAQTEAERQALQQIQALQSRVAQIRAGTDTQAAPTTRVPTRAQATTPVPRALPRPPTTAPAAIPPPAPRPVTAAATPPPRLAPTAADVKISAQRVIDEAAFREMIRNLMPLSPQQIVRLRQMYNASKFAEASPAGTPPKPVSTSQFVRLAPGSTPPVVRLAQGIVSSVLFLDQTGAPWPIVAYDLGNPKAFNIQWDRRSNMLMIQSQDLYTTANLAVRLQGLNTSVMLELIPGQKQVDYRVDMRIQGFGPNAKLLPIGTGLPSGNNPILLGVLDGVRPPSSVALDVVGGPAQVWSTKKLLYVRTRMTLISPGYKWSYQSADGMHAYEIPNPNASVLLASDHGQLVTLRIKGR